MKVEDIKTWQSRITPASSDDDIISYKQTEIDDLRAALKERDAEIISLRSQWEQSRNETDAAHTHLTAQRLVMQQALKGAYIPTYLERLAASPATLEAAFTALRSEALDLRAALAERDAKLAALEKQEPMAWLVYGNGSHRYSTLTFDVSQVPDIYVGGDVVALYAAACAAPVPEDWRSAVAMAYGHLWHVNNEPMAPIPLRSEESASYAARKLLRDLLTTEERGEAINAVQKLLAAAPKDAP